MMLTIRDLIVILAVLLLVAIMITLFPIPAAAYGGGCTLVTVQYWSPEYGAYITTYEWDCPSSTMQPRSFQGYNYGYSYGYDSSGSYHSYYY